MVRFFLVGLLSCFSFASELETSKSIQPRIINGQQASPDKHDYFVVLMKRHWWLGDGGGYHYRPFCGASYLGNGLVVTAAHCVESIAPTTLVAILIGNHSSEMADEYCSGDKTDVTFTCQTEPGIGFHLTGYAAYRGAQSKLQYVTGSNITVHPNYAEAVQNDIAIIELTSSPTNTPLTLPKGDIFKSLADSAAADSVLVIGHGDIISDTDKFTFQSSPKLLEVALTPRQSVVCENFFGSSFNDYRMVCAGDPRKDSCQGDSGGPLIDPITSTLLGIVSFGPPQCGAPDVSYGAYTNVYNYVEWIESRGQSGVNDEFTKVVKRSSGSSGALGFPLLLMTLGLLLCRRK